MTLGGLGGLMLGMALTSLSTVLIYIALALFAATRSRTRSGGYIMGMVVLAFFNAILAFLLYFFLGLPFPPLIATVAFCITLIPLVVSVMFWIIGTGLALFTDPVGALVFGIVYLVYMQIEAYVITPRVMNRTISIPGSLVVGALAGGTLLGLLGALVAVPIAASILIVIIKQVWAPRQDAQV